MALIETASPSASRDLYSTQIRAASSTVEFIADGLPSRRADSGRGDLTNIRHAIRDVTSTTEDLIESMWACFGSTHHATAKVNRDDAVAKYCVGEARTYLSEIEYACRTEDSELAYWSARFAVEQLRACIKALRSMIDVTTAVAA